MPKAYVLGGINYDTTLRMPALPAPGETVFGDSIQHDIGGKGLNQAVALRRAGLDVTLLGAVGQDAEADMGERIERRAF